MSWEPGDQLYSKVSRRLRAELFREEVQDQPGRHMRAHLTTMKVSCDGFPLQGALEDDCMLDAEVASTPATLLKVQGNNRTKSTQHTVSLYLIDHFKK